MHSWHVACHIRFNMACWQMRGSVGCWKTAVGKGSDTQTTSAAHTRVLFTALSIRRGPLVGLTSKRPALKSYPSLNGEVRNKTWPTPQFRPSSGSSSTVYMVHATLRETDMSGLIFIKSLRMSWDRFILSYVRACVCVVCVCVCGGCGIKEQQDM